jgi:hypothetical protein
VKVLSFGEWRDKMLEERGGIDTSPCDDCEGGGMRECDMGHSHACQTCEGSGKINALTKEHYEKDLAETLLLYSEWTGWGGLPDLVCRNGEKIAPCTPIAFTPNLGRTKSYSITFVVA